MTWVDIAIIVILAGTTFAGFRQGFIVEVATIVGAVVALAVARLEYHNVRHVLAQVLSHSPWLTAISYLVIFMVVWGVIIFAAQRLRSAVRMLMLGGVDRLGGAIIGLLQGILLVELLLYIGRRLPAHDLRHAINHAQLTPIFTHALPLLHKLFPHVTA